MKPITPLQTSVVGLLFTIILSLPAHAQGTPKPSTSVQGTAAASMFTASEWPGELNPDEDQAARDALSREVKRRQYRDIKQDIIELGTPSVSIHH